MSETRVGPKSGTCGMCGRETGSLKYHQRTCDPKMRALITRSTAHVRPADVKLRAGQRWQNGVTDLDVARVMLAIERGAVLYRSRLGRWCAPHGHPLGLGRSLSTTVLEMLRTGLLRHYRDREGDHLIPAGVHLDLHGDAESACHFIGENLGPMRSRLVPVTDLALIDCLECERVVSQGM